MGLSKNAILRPRGGDSPQQAIKQINALPWRIKPPKKEGGIFRQSRSDLASVIAQFDDLVSDELRQQKEFCAAQKQGRDKVNGATEPHAYCDQRNTLQRT